MILLLRTSFLLALWSALVLLLVHPGTCADGQDNAFHRALQQAADGASTTEAESKVTRAVEADPFELVERLIDDRDFLGVMKDMVGKNEDLRSLWSTRAYEIITKAPYMRSIKGLDQLASKDAADVTTEDNLAALDTLSKFMSSVSNNLERLATPSSFLEMAQEYGASPQLQPLLAAAGEGDAPAMLKLQQAIVDKELGGMVDLKAFGFDGSEAAPLRMLKELVQSLEFDMWGIAHGGDESIKELLEDPYKATMKSLNAAGVVLPKY